MSVHGDEKEARQVRKPGRASARGRGASIRQCEVERGMRMAWIPFALMLALYAVWEAVA